ncbi:MAG: sigma-54-dependent Fis family transcriptional regulator, partial [Myxococcales bacterium]|nr:sigma-54-dependent Fis family transcriptional regulator [Myxococcales bacterium]
CGAIPEGLCESELFGHVRGAFTGAHRRHAGAFERACGGTLFLDEIAELPLPLQAKLLRVLETGKIVPVGGEHEIEVDVRVVSASHQRLDRLADQGRFREDLYHRLGVFTIRVPPLRERPEDIPLLIEQFAREIGNELRRPVRFDPSTIAAAKIAAWPGNIRELRNCLFRAAALSDEPITPSRLLARTVAPHSAGEPLAETITIPRGSYAAMKRALIRRYLTEKGSIRKAARALEVPRSTFGAWLKK